MWVDNWKESLQQVKDNKILQLHTQKKLVEYQIQIVTK
ncbi:hypothetical protein [uncultured Gammaproteobacteria bacterium]|nr:hypothetical protein [uncultured Gammaproteobacteria bacterium]CAC9512598.1 hypothetical protein [uncultured Gammaproteobacteria bacterium]CAC9989816.1 hypothetical protein [uncultured Gammaproteobacteria bacterium]